MKNEIMELIKKKLRQISSKFPRYVIEVEYQIEACSYIIKVSPLKDYLKDEAFAIAEDELMNFFEEELPEENFIFLEDDEIFDINTPDLRLVRGLHTVKTQFPSKEIQASNKINVIGGMNYTGNVIKETHDIRVAHNTTEVERPSSMVTKPSQPYRSFNDETTRAQAS